MNHSSTLEFSSRSPVSVYSTGSCSIYLAGFLGSLVTAAIRAAGALRYYQVRQHGGFASRDKPTPFNGLFRQPARLSLLRLHFVPAAGRGILTACPFRCPSSPGFPLCPDLPRSDYRWPGNLDLSVGGFLARLIVTYAYICSSKRSSTARAAPSPPLAMLSYRYRYPTVSVPRFMPDYYPCPVTLLVSCYALFE